MFAKIKNFFSRIWEKVKKPLVWTVAIAIVPVSFVTAWCWGTALGAGAGWAFVGWFAAWFLSIGVFVICETLIRDWALAAAFKAAADEMKASEARRAERVRQYEEARQNLRNLHRGVGV